MKKVSNLIPALLIAAGIVVLGLCIKGGIDNMAFRDRQVAVRGLCEREVPANRVTWPIMFTETGNDLLTIYDKYNRTSNTVVKFLRDNGIDSTEITVGTTPSIYDQTSNRYASDNIRFNYSITGTVTVVSSKVDQVRSLMSRQTELLKEGVALNTDNYQAQATYEYTDLNSIKPDMIAEATRNAREAAIKFAADSDSRLGKIKTASQGQFSIENRDETSPFIKNVRVVTTIVYYLED